MPHIKRGLSQYEHIIQELEVLLDALDNLNIALLCTLRLFLLHVVLHLKVHYPEYEKVLDKVENYYDPPFLNFKYDKNILAIQNTTFL